MYLRLSGKLRSRALKSPNSLMNPIITLPQLSMTLMPSITIPTSSGSTSPSLQIVCIPISISCNVPLCTLSVGGLNNPNTQHFLSTMLNNTIENYKQKYKVEFLHELQFHRRKFISCRVKFMEAHFNVMKKSTTRGSPPIKLVYFVFMNVMSETILIFCVTSVKYLCTLFKWIYILIKKTIFKCITTKKGLNLFFECIEIQ